MRGLASGRRGDLFFGGSPNPFYLSPAKRRRGGCVSRAWPGDIRRDVRVTCNACPASQLQHTAENFFVDRQVIVAWRTERIEHTRRQQRFHSVWHIAREVEGVAR